MQLAVVTDAEWLPGEAAIINRLFGAGMRCLHLRKPGAAEKDIRQLLQAIDSRYYPRIALHQWHAMAGEYGITRLHYTEAQRSVTDEKALQQLKQNGFTLSTAVHSVQDYAALPGCFAYALLSPVFNSISKPGYRGIWQHGFVLPAAATAAMALGGVHAGNIADLRRAGFAGAAVLGCIWTERSQALQTFISLQQLCSETI